MRRLKLTATLLAIAGLLLTQDPDGARAAPVTTFDANASEWSSATPTILFTQFPIGGSGQVNGNFVIVEDAAFPNVQIGIRASERFSPTPLSNNNADYFSDAGESDPGLPKWNYDFHIDLRGSGFAFSDFDIALVTTVANHSSPDLQAALEAALVVPPGTADGVVLFQTSQNPGFFGSGIDPFAAASYPFQLSLTPKVPGVGPTLIADMTVHVPEPASIALAVCGLACMAPIGRRSRR